MTKRNDLGQPILFETPNNSHGHFEFAQFYGSGYALRGISQSGEYAYLGLFEQAEIRGLAKAILNAMEPESLVENQKAPEPAYKPGDWVKVADDSPYSDNFHGQTLRLHDDQSGYPANDLAVLLVGAAGYRGSVMKKYITPASAPEPAIVPAPFKVGDRVRVVSDEFNPRDGSRGDLGTVSEIRYPYVAVNVDGKTLGFPFKSDEIEHAPVEQGYDVPALVASVADLEDRVAALESKPEPEPTLWGYKVGDLVKYTRMGTLPGEMRRVSAIHKADGIIGLANPQTGKTVGSAAAASEITRA